MPLRQTRCLTLVREILAVGLTTPFAVSLSGCTVPASPALPLFGAYFPSWLICASVGVIGAVIIRAVLIKLGIDEILTWRLLVYACLAAVIGFALALTVYGR
ncbi:YtcA family lipoprotein [Kaistia dalseonensis]|uniref:YtcA family lipoprotein n=1 Tax=Kaistia dalseonensis TaxID=410840 RepID=UPI0022566213|nr:YtcA family lipoprotein [Kaistia dalseonensis]MCX5495719.1 YtcA family lipoprotein [Kaistia dalseonensis]